MTSDSAPERKFWQIALADLERQLGASPNGLSSAEAAARRLRYGPKPAEPEPNRSFRHAYPSAVRAILDDPPIHIRPNLPAHCGCRGKEPCGFSHFGVVIIPPRGFDRHQILLTTRHESVHKRLRFFADRAAKKWPLRGSLKLGVGCL